MSHDTDELFDLNLLAERVGLPPARETQGRIASAADRAYILGELHAIERNPTPEQKLIRDLAARCTIDAEGKVQLPSDTPSDIRDAERTPASIADHAKAIAWIAHRVRARASVPVRS